MIHLCPECGGNGTKPMRRDNRIVGTEFCRACKGTGQVQGYVLEPPLPLRDARSLRIMLEMAQDRLREIMRLGLEDTRDFRDDVRKDRDLIRDILSELNLRGLHP